MSIRLQIAGGLALHRMKRGTFSDILKPVANNLLLTGDCMVPGDPINTRFFNYLEANWRRVFIVAGMTEAGPPSEAVTDAQGSTNCLRWGTPHTENWKKEKGIWDTESFKICTHNATMDLGRGLSASRNRIVAVTNRPCDSTYTRKLQEGILMEELDKGHRSAVVSYGRLDMDSLVGDISVVAQGCGEFNQFNPNRGPVMNRRTDRNFLPKASYRPDFSVELDPFMFPEAFKNITLFPNAVTTVWPVAVVHQMA